MRIAFMGLAAVVTLALAACESCNPSLPKCQSDADCASNQSCQNQVCTTGGGSSGAAPSSSTGSGASSSSGSNGCPGGCPLGDVCRDAACVHSTSCTDAGVCLDDSYCLNGACVPYGMPTGHDSNPDCQQTLDIQAITPDVQCRWTTPGTGDP